MEPQPQFQYEEDPFRARDKVNPPALLLMVAAAVGIVFAFCSMPGSIQAILSGGQLAPEQAEALRRFGFPEPTPQQQYLSAIFNLGFSALQMFVSGVIIFGAWRMRQLKSLGFAQVAAILSVIPFIAPCCGCTTIPIGIWAIVVLFNRDVQDAFSREAASQADYGPADQWGDGG